ncbi:hypothetical protein CHS0354_018408 [Potamilus streckersoni]|uniref:Uncharacterized protein n=1 Tax=Potamilus streckersoni TaxID=2493646 RepID=A0AAE0TBJ0_9BIVA|nr:hypothetical protein CHS0354_018408 [Potamilus streckersoni]
MLALLIIFAPAQVPDLYADEPYTGGTPAGRSSGRAIFPDYNNSTRQPEGADPLPPTLRPKNSAGYPPGSENGNGENLPGGGLAPGSLNAPRNDRSEWGYDLDKSKNLPVVSTQPLNKEDTPAESATAPGEEPNIYVDSVIYNEELIEAGRTQIIQINLANRRKLTGSHEMRLRITKPDGKNEYLSFRNVRVTGRTVEPVIYRYPSDKTLEGEYRTQVSLHRNGEPRPLYVYDSPFIFNAYLREGHAGRESSLGAVDGAEPGSFIGVPGAAGGAGGQLPGNGQTSADGNKLLPDAAGADELQGAGTGVSASNQTQGAQGGNTRAGAAGTPGSRTAVSGGRTAGGTQTTRLNPNNVIDLEWKDLKISNSNILRGESTSGYVYLTNNSAHIAENVTYTFYLAPELLKDNYSQSTQILTGSYPFVAPGETKLIQIPIDIKQDVLPGTYVVIGEIDRSIPFPN